ncbi:MAG TPA: molybdopterin-synthase adenylyltransferase MoeB, partial [Thermoanaerobaculia bacterium]|nr:molybdopterin-synthase adenylyltransferase MoeB [Thermoanaerobaculia bacterium]
YARQLTLAEIGVEGQQKLARSSVLIIGAGGLGSPAALYLAAAGVGHIGLVDFDRVDASNLHRQILYATADAGRAKLDAARERLHALNPHVTIKTHATRLTSANALDILRGYDVILDGTDNFPTRYLVNDACVLLSKPNVYGSVLRFEGQASVFSTPDAPCYRCLYPEPPPAHLVPSCAEAGVLGVLPGVIGTIQATEAIKIITGAGETLAGRLLLYDALRMNFRVMKLRRRCDEHAPITKLPDNVNDYEELCHPVTDTNITPTELAEKLSDFVLIDVREPYEWNVGHIEGAVHIPMQQIPQRLAEIPRDRDVVMICRVGGRSENARRYLAQNGYTRVKNLIGGMQRWAREVDPTVRVA